MARIWTQIATNHHKHRRSGDHHVTSMVENTAPRPTICGRGRHQHCAPAPSMSYPTDGGWGLEVITEDDVAGLRGSTELVMRRCAARRYSRPPYPQDGAQPGDVGDHALNAHGTNVGEQISPSVPRRSSGQSAWRRAGISGAPRVTLTDDECRYLPGKGWRFTTGSRQASSAPDRAHLCLVKSVPGALHYGCRVSGEGHVVVVLMLLRSALPH